VTAATVDVQQTVAKTPVAARVTVLRQPSVLARETQQLRMFGVALSFVSSFMGL
jgi:hypothetical protein